MIPMLNMNETIWNICATIATLQSLLAGCAIVERERSLTPEAQQLNRTSYALCKRRWTRVRTLLRVVGVAHVKYKAKGVTKRGARSVISFAFFHIHPDT